MKNFLVCVSFLAVVPALANSLQLTGKILDVSCGEVDSFVIGDACVVLIQDDGLNLTAVVGDFDDFAMMDPNIRKGRVSRITGKVATVGKACLRNPSKEEASVLGNNYSWDSKKLEFKILKDIGCLKFLRK